MGEVAGGRVSGEPRFTVKVATGSLLGVDVSREGALLWLGGYRTETGDLTGHLDALGVHEQLRTHRESLSGIVVTRIA